jgi:endoglucanase
MGVGWNLGNSLEAMGPGDETAWGNPVVTQAFIDAVNAAGFDTIRIPVAWSDFSNPADLTIDSSWFNRVEEVASYALEADMYVIMNEHWDGGWLNHPTYDRQDDLNHRLSVMWTQIATHFRDYDHRLLFAGTNEVLMENGYTTPTEEYYTVQNSFNQTFVDAVRATGGNNVDRYLVVQGFNTNIDHTVSFVRIPEDSAIDRLLLEVHYYDPYQFTLDGDRESFASQWGERATDPEETAGWGDEDWADAQLDKMKTHFIDQGVGVILGEYGVISRMGISDHEDYRVYWNEYITRSAIKHGLVPIYWDNGATGDGGMGLFDRGTGNQVYPGIISAIVSAVGYRRASRRF